MKVAAYSCVNSGKLLKNLIDASRGTRFFSPVGNYLIIDTLIFYSAFMPYYYVLDHIKNEILQSRLPVFFFNNAVGALELDNSQLTVSVPLRGPRKFKLCVCNSCCIYNSYVSPIKYEIKFQNDNPLFPLMSKYPNYYTSISSLDMGQSLESQTMQFMIKNKIKSKFTHSFISDGGRLYSVEDIKLDDEAYRLNRIYGHCPGVKKPLNSKRLLAQDFLIRFKNKFEIPKDRVFLKKTLSSQPIIYNKYIAKRLHGFFYVML